jgi:hypothetical protein
MATAQIPKAAVDKSAAGYQVREHPHQQGIPLLLEAAVRIGDTCITRCHPPTH